MEYQSGPFAIIVLVIALSPATLQYEDPTDCPSGSCGVDCSRGEDPTVCVKIGRSHSESGKCLDCSGKRVLDGSCNIFRNCPAEDQMIFAWTRERAERIMMKTAGKSEEETEGKNEENTENKPGEKKKEIKHSEKMKELEPGGKKEEHKPSKKTKGHEPSEKTNEHKPSEKTKEHRLSEKKEEHKPSEKKKGHKSSEKKEEHKPK